LQGRPREVLRLIPKIPQKSCRLRK